MHATFIEVQNPYDVVRVMNKKITLACTSCSNRNYTTYKNALTSPKRLEMNKYCKRCGKHVLHSETK